MRPSAEVQVEASASGEGATSTTSARSCPQAVVATGRPDSELYRARGPSRSPPQRAPRTAACGQVRRAKPEQAEGMLSLLKRHEIQALRHADHSQEDVATSAPEYRSAPSRGSRTRTRWRTVDDAAERVTRGIGRPAKAEPFRAFIAEVLAQEPRLDVARDPPTRSAQGLRGRQERAVPAHRQSPAAEDRASVVRFEGLPGEFSQHDFGHVDVPLRRRHGQRRVHFFATRLKYSRWVQVTLVPNERDRDAGPHTRRPFRGARGDPAGRGL